MAAQPSLQCYVGAWRTHAPFAGVFVFLYGVCIPLLFWAILLYHRKQPEGFASARFVSRYSALTLPYLPSKWYFEIINLSRRAMIILALDLLARVDNVSVQVNVVVLVIVIYLVLSLFLSPYHMSWLNRLTAVWMVCCAYFSLGALTLSYAQSVAADPNKVFNSSESRLIGSLLVFALAFCITLSAVVTYMEFHMHLIIKSHRLSSMPLDYAQCDAELASQSRILFPGSPFLVEKWHQLNLVRKRAVMDDMMRLSSRNGSFTVVKPNSPMLEIDFVNDGIELAAAKSPSNDSIAPDGHSHGNGNLLTIE